MLSLHRLSAVNRGAFKSAVGTVHLVLEEQIALSR